MTQSLVDQFLEMVRISSVSRQEGQFAAYARQVLEDMGFTVEFDTAGEKAGSDTGNLIATLPGNKAAEALMFCCHMDTVTPGENIQPVIDGEVIRSDGTTILGGDDKAGIAAIFEGIRRIQTRGIPHGPLQRDKGPVLWRSRRVAPGAKPVAKDPQVLRTELRRAAS